MLLEKITQSLTGENESISLQLSRLGKKIRIVLSTELGEVPADASPEVVAMREAIAKPLVLMNTPEHILNDLNEHIAAYSEIVGSAKSQLAMMEQGVNKAAACSGATTDEKKPIAKTKAKKEAVPDTGDTGDTPDAPQDDIFNSQKSAF